METREEFEEASTRFECKKVALRHTKDGVVISFAIHPDDVPMDMIKDFLGQRYLAVLVRLNDHDEPVVSKDAQEGIMAVKIAGVICGDPEFQAWLVTIGMIEEATEESAAEALRGYLDITSRKELRTNAAARKKFSDLRSEFIQTFRR